MKNEGMASHRCGTNPLEETFALIWNEINSFPVGNDTLDYMLAKKVNHPCGEVTDRDRTVAATVVQWLGSSVGQCFLRDVREAYEEGIDEEMIAENKR